MAGDKPDNLRRSMKLLA